MKPTTGTWTVGQYTPTEAFKKIDNHSCVCDADTMALICLTGPADDRQSQVDADLFSASKELLAVVEKFMDLCPRVSDYEPMAGALSDACQEARSAVAKAKGRTEKITA